MSRASDRDRAFGQRVADVREFYGMSQTDLARRTTAKHQVTLARIENGDRPATIGEAQSIAAALGVPLGELLDNDVPTPVKCPECIQTRQRVLAAIGIRSAGDHGEMDYAACDRGICWLERGHDGDCQPGPGRPAATFESDVLQEAVDRIEVELICCDVFERLSAKPTGQWSKDERGEYRSHSICYWGGAARQIVLDVLTPPTQSPGGVA